ncbi:glycosyltransferase 87 family protein [Streptomonospora sp. S1-112]|uniref:Glycosyltransferase 87 family protein n=1 Tax=Streptomonospora mangrovi TaxID=2883123 RepID=A0A9X3SNQ1_9ACTN|nr:glycosyltransferase 87 family protein [Streptomonospora mangrovi]MDA0565286.1 glycosyltransferase 87 family protein [Streptomonospora mangrovi]
MSSTERAGGAAAGPPSASPEARRATLWLAALGALGAVAAYLAKWPCRFGGAWSDGTQYAAGCYSDVFPLYFRDALDSGSVPYLDVPTEYPVLTGGLMYVVARTVAWLPDETARAFGYFDLTAAAMGACLVAAVVGVGHLAGRGGIAPAPGTAFRPRAALLAGGLVALSPAGVLTGLINWDLLAVALFTGGLVAYAHGRQWSAGALFGLATAAKFYPFLVFGPLFVLMVRELVRREGGPGAVTVGGFLRPLAAGALAWGAVNLPVYLAAPHNWATFFTFSRERGTDWGSLYYALGGYGVFPSGDLDLVNATGMAALLAACAGVAALAVFARRRPPLEQLVLLVVAAFLLTNKVWSPQFVLWLLPLAALAWPRTLPAAPALVVFGLWQLAEVGYFFGIWQHLLWVTQQTGPAVPGTGAGLDVAAYSLLLLGRWTTVLGVCALTVVDNLRRGGSTA